LPSAALAQALLADLSSIPAAAAKSASDIQSASGIVAPRSRDHLAGERFRLRPAALSVQRPVDVADIKSALATEFRQAASFKHEPGPYLLDQFRRYGIHRKQSHIVLCDMKSSDAITVQGQFDGKRDRACGAGYQRSEEAVWGRDGLGPRTRLKVAQSTVAGWRKRGSVPDRYLSAGPGNVGYTFTTAPMLWNDEEHHALAVALARLFRDHGHKYASFEEFAIGGLSVSSSLWSYLVEAQRELRDLCNETGLNPSQAMLQLARDTIGKPAAHPPDFQVRVTDGDPDA
jgi:hypothetical protein